VTDDSRRIRHLKAADLAEREGVPVSTVYGWNYSGEGPPYFRVGRHVRYRLEDVEWWELERIVDRSDRYKAIERTGRRQYESQVREYEQRLRELSGRSASWRSALTLLVHNHRRHPNSSSHRNHRHGPSKSTGRCSIAS
jgi:Helix-turn-helix domain